MKLRCYIIDDEAHAVAYLKALVERTDSLELIGSATSPVFALKEITKLRPDVVFSDIDMPDLNGLELAAVLKDRARLIFTTSYRDYAVDAFEHEAVDYLLKPFSTERFQAAVEKLLAGTPISAEAAPSRFFVKSGARGTLLPVEPGDVIFASALSNYIEINMLDRKIVTYLTLEELLQNLPRDRFLRIHRSHIINTAYIKRIESDQIILSDGSALTVGRTYQKSFQLAIAGRSLISSRENSDKAK
ncbi:LytR/AlgR family response regulator transcription factor [Mucilaginibacter agri]|uniref:Response regulator n=1 Tax=Mucilaginibacter agri TaxID=2695265 RepID=A0A965ZDK6_9SPHI|nr:LytTR family DNA-binding domain-containing protein [Mucilaginibacter agri]NCD69093.1 response regulator [Mucilaginibacter agri]